ncbi:hypothetical protein JVT61DRAFT_4835 [Boletus reticuloceps]|uniref:Uncharacterized protein n=1 Tax=Boletus reticuloceps TaxID=495285 RepID=A0A8I2YN94_9AGAM|nr:hypothetical protein JVT61DRAFT_4835 [Boletus reticuloceps]
MPPRRAHACPATPSDLPEESSPVGNDPIEDADVDDIPGISWNVAAHSSPFPQVPPSVAAPPRLSRAPLSGSMRMLMSMLTSPKPLPSWKTFPG